MSYLRQTGICPWRIQCRVTNVTVVGSESSWVRSRGDRHQMDNLWSLVGSRGGLSPGGLVDFVVSKAANDVWPPKSHLICRSWEALDSFNRRDWITVGITGLNCFLVSGPFSASWPCDHKDRGSLQERNYCSANTFTMNLPDSQYFLKEACGYDQYVSTGELRKLLDLSRLIGSELTPV